MIFNKTLAAKNTSIWRVVPNIWAIAMLLISVNMVLNILTRDNDAIDLLKLIKE